MMTSRQRLLCALNGQKPDRLPVTTHHIMPYFLKKYMNGMSNHEFFDFFGMDAIEWLLPLKGNIDEYVKKYPMPWDYGAATLVCSDQWCIEVETLEGHNYPAIRASFITPGGTLSMVLEFNGYTGWITEHLIKSKRDIDILGQYMVAPMCDVAALNTSAKGIGDRGIIRGHVCGFDFLGQPGTWQDAACLVGIQRLIMQTYDDPSWVHQLLNILQNRKHIFIESLKGAKYDIIELGGGDASSTVISPRIFDEYVAPYDTPLIEHAHSVGQRIVYHTCGGMMPILENIAQMKPDAMETFTPVDMGGDVDLAVARRRVPENICMIGGFDQFHFFTECDEQKTRSEVRRCFDAVGPIGGFILCPSDHFFDADPNLIAVFADEARNCFYV